MIGIILGRFGAESRLDDSAAFHSDSRDTPTNDLPPPYSECANNEETPVADDNKPVGTEEPPPPYSACYFSNPKDGMPTVHFNRRREISDSGQSSRDPVTPSISSDLEANKAPSDVSCDDRGVSNTNQICEVRVSGEIDSDIQNIQNENIEGVSGRRMDHVVEIVETDPQRVVSV
jgi:hypothetical protein